MKKQELMSEIEMIIEELELSPNDFADLHVLEPQYDVWAYRTGWCSARLKILLNRLLTETIHK